MPYSAGRYTLICTAALFAFSSFIILSAYNANGVGWDFVSHYLNGRTIGSTLLGLPVPWGLFNHAHALSVAGNFYFDDVWEPMSPALIGIAILIFKGMVFQAYLVFMILLLVLSSFFAAKKLNVNPLLLTSVMLGPYVVSYTILYNGSEILALSMALFTIGFAVAKDYRAGIFAGLTGLTKYNAMIILPVLLLLGDRKKVRNSILASLAITAPWFVFNTVMYANPLQSYVTSISEAFLPASNAVGLPQATWIVVWYPALLLAAGIAAVLMRAKSKRRINIKAKVLSHRNISVLAFTTLGVIGFFLVYGNADGAIRLGYLAYGGIAMMSAMAIDAITAKKRRIVLANAAPFVVFGLSLLVLLMLYLSWLQVNFHVLGSLGSKNIEYASAVNALETQGLGGCAVVSNAWPYLDLYNVTAYSPYFCNSTVTRFPVVAFWNSGVGNYCSGSIDNIANVSKELRYANFTIYLPTDYVCAR